MKTYAEKNKPGRKMVAVVIPVYNMELYLDKCMKSVLDQTYDEYIVYLVNDGSTDQSGNKCKEWAAQCNKVRYLEKQNGGLPSARNFGLDAIREHTDYVLFIDSDDYLEEDFLEKSIQFMQGHDFAISSYTSVNEKFEEIGRCEFKAGEYTFKDNEARYDFIINELLPYNVGWEVWGKLFDYEIIKKNHLRFSTNRELYEDLLFTLQYMSYCCSVIVFRDRLYNYLIRNNSMSRIEKNKYDCVNDMLKEYYQSVQDEIDPITFSKIHSYAIYNEVLRNNGKFGKFHIRDSDFFIQNIKLYLAEKPSTKFDLSARNVLTAILETAL